MDEADVVAYTTLTDRYLKRFGNFVENHFCSLVRSVSDESQEGNVHPSGASLGSSGDFLGLGEVSEGTLSNVTLHTSSRHIWDGVRHPIRIHWSPTAETQSFEELTCIPHPLDGNPDVQKVMLVLVTITNQAKSLKRSGEVIFVNSIVLYGDTGADTDCHNGHTDQKDASTVAETEGEGHTTISKLLPLLLDLLEYLQSCTDFVRHWVAQVAALFKETKPHVVSISNLQLYTVFREFSDLLGLLVILDEVVANQLTLQEHWNKYKQMIKSVRADSKSFNADPNDLLRLERDLVQIDKYIMSARIYRNLVDSVLQQNQRVLTKNILLADKFLSFVTSFASDIDKQEVLISSSDFSPDYRPISLAAMYVFSASLFPASFDTKKVFSKVVWEQLKNIYGVALPGAGLWIPEKFLNKAIQSNGTQTFDQRAIQNLLSQREQFLSQKVGNLGKDLLQWNFQYSSWTVRLQEVLYMKDLSVIGMADLSMKCILLVEGLKLAQTLSHTFKLILNLHASLRRPIRKTVVVQLCQVLELLKLIESTFFQFSVRLCCSTMYIMQYVMHTAIVTVRKVQKSILSSTELQNRGGRVDESRADALSVLKILEHCLRGTLSQKRFLVGQICLDWITSANSASRLWKDDESSLILSAAFERLGQLINLERNVERYCDGSQVFFHRVILSTYFSSLYDNPSESSKLPQIFLIIRDCLKFLRKSGRINEESLRNSVFLREVESYLKHQYVDKLCQDVETDLRLLSHLHLQVDSGGTGAPTSSQGNHPPPPFRTGVKNLETILEVPQLSWNNSSNLSFQTVVEHYLSKTYYNLASVALHDWQSYATMRVLASDKYKLTVLDDHLPGHSLEQGRDILEIVRNLGQFVVEFTYNLNNQVFVQVNSPNKHLDTVSIRHLANSLRTHGPGMANTTINATYKFLRSKIHALSQFLYNEQIKSRLLKDIKIFKQALSQPEVSSVISSQQSAYSYAASLFDRANKFKKGIRNLGVTPDGLSHLDQFRVLITHIGNALGYRENIGVF